MFFLLSSVKISSSASPFSVGELYIESYLLCFRLDIGMTACLIININIHTIMLNFISASFQAVSHMVFLFVGEQLDFCLLVESENGSCSLPLDETYSCLGHDLASLLTTTFLKAFCGSSGVGRVDR